MQWPGRPAEIWDSSAEATARQSRPAPVPVLSSPEQVHRWLDKSRMQATETYTLPIWWIGFAAVATGLVAWLTFASPPQSRGELWPVWVAVVGWLLGAIGVLVFRARVYPRRYRQEAQWTFENGFVCEVHASPFEFDGGEGMHRTARIFIDHRVADDHAARMVRAFREWLRDDDVQLSLHHGALHSYACIASEEVFGPDAAGAFFMASNATERSFVLLTPLPEQRRQASEPWWREAQVTEVPES